MYAHAALGAHGGIVLIADGDRDISIVRGRGVCLHRAGGFIDGKRFGIGRCIGEFAVSVLRDLRAQNGFGIAQPQSIRIAFKVDIADFRGGQHFDLRRAQHIARFVYGAQLRDARRGYGFRGVRIYIRFGSGDFDGGCIVFQFVGAEMAGFMRNRDRALHARADSGGRGDGQRRIRRQRFYCDGQDGFLRIYQIGCFRRGIDFRFGRVLRHKFAIDGQQRMAARGIGVCCIVRFGACIQIGFDFWFGVHRAQAVRVHPAYDYFFII